MFRRLIAAVIVLAWPILASAECLTTLPPSPAFVPPAPFSPTSPWASSGGFWYGTDWLWTNVPFNATWNMRDNVGKGKFYRTKLVYWQPGFDWRSQPEPELVVKARRLDGEEPPVSGEPGKAVFVTSKTPAIMTAIDIPSAGCWEITASYEGHTLSFVVSVEP